MCAWAHTCTCTYTYHIYTHTGGDRERQRERKGGYLPEVSGDTGQKHTILCRYKLYIQDNKYKEVGSRQMIAWDPKKRGVGQRTGDLDREMGNGY